MIGRTLAQYSILEKIGQGGMGEVWKARDTSLNREVAIKILPEEFAQDSDRLARFEQEATLLGGLDHPNLATIHGLHHEDGIHFLAMELVSGMDLARQLENGPLSVQDALEIGAQVADALAAAHDQGVVHRDLKPGNIMVTPEGKAKVLDFGLARSIVGDPGSSSGLLTQSPTLAGPATLQGVILGTAAYMSPEQARGKPVDRRTDLWAFGCVLYEMLTGHVLYAGETVSDTVAKILEREPDWDRLPEKTPLGIRKLLRRCLTKDARKRQQSAGDARLEIEDALSGSPEGEPASTVTVQSRSRVAMLALLAIPVAALGAWLLKPNPEPPNTTPLHAEINAPEGLVVHAVGNSLALSPDGTKLAFIARTHHPEGVPDTSRIYIRTLGEDQAVPVPGTDSSEEDVGTPWNLFFSPDGGWLGYMDRGNGLKKVEIGTARPVTICEGPSHGGATWGPDGTIVFSRMSGGLLRVRAAGGEPDTLTRLQGLEGLHNQPRFLPGGRRLLFTVRGYDYWDWSRASINILDLETGERKQVLENAADARYVASGHLLFARGFNVFAVPFDLDGMKVTGTAVPVLQGVRRQIGMNNSGLETGATAFSVSDNGLLAYVPGGSYPGWRSKVVQVDRAGNEEPLRIRNATWVSVRLSADGGQALLWEAFGGVWLYDLERGTMRQQSIGATFPRWPGWGPGADQFTFEAGMNGEAAVFTKALNSGPSELERVPIDGHGVPCAWSPGGTELLVRLDTPNSDGMSLVSHSPDAGLREIIRSEFYFGWVDFSPDGKWIVYGSNEAGSEFHVFVRPFPGPGASIQISGEDQAVRSCWSRDGDEIFYQTGTDSSVVMNAVPVTVEEGQLVPGKPVRLFEGLYLGITPNRSWDVGQDGRFLMIQRIPDHPDLDDWTHGATRIRVVQNWFEELKAVASTEE